MSLRLLPAMLMDDEDDDGNFTKWMSSYWGHGAETGQARDRKRSFRRPTRSNVDRRASLPCVSQMDAVSLNRLHAAAMTPAPIHLKMREEKGEVRPHPRARRTSSDDHGRPKQCIPESSRITSIPELTESFEKRLCFRQKKTILLSDADNLCLICHEEMRNGREAVRELHCTHRFHKEAARRSEQIRSRSGSTAAQCEKKGRPLNERRKSADEPLLEEPQYHLFRRQLSLRRKR